MKTLIDFIMEGAEEVTGSAAELIVNVCLAAENDRRGYDQMLALTNALIKRYKKGDFDVIKLETSSVVDKLCKSFYDEYVKSTDEPIRLTPAIRKVLRKYITAMILNEMRNEIELNKVDIDYLHEYDYDDLEY